MRAQRAMLLDQNGVLAHTLHVSERPVHRRSRLRASTMHERGGPSAAPLS